MHQGGEAVEDPLMPLAGLQFVPLHGVWDHRPWQHMDGRYPNPGQDCQRQDDGEACGGGDQHQRNLHGCPEGHADDVGPSLAPPFRDPQPDGEGEDGGHEDRGHDEVAASLPS